MPVAGLQEGKSDRIPSSRPFQFLTSLATGMPAVLQRLLTEFQWTVAGQDVNTRHHFSFQARMHAAERIHTGAENTAKKCVSPCHRQVPVAMSGYTVGT